MNVRMEDIESTSVSYVGFESGVTVLSHLSYSSLMAPSTETITGSRNIGFNLKGREKNGLCLNPACRAV